MAEGKLLGVEKDGWIYVGEYKRSFNYEIKETDEEISIASKTPAPIILLEYTIHNRDKTYAHFMPNESVKEKLIRLHNQAGKKSKGVEIRGLEKAVIHSLE
ncbi:MAG: hypothetical protein AABW50_01410 [Nanoarchaeota archaeon]